MKTRRNPPKSPLDHEPAAVTYAPAPRGALSYSRLSREELEGGFWV